MSQNSPLTYADSGVVPAGKPLSGLISWVNKTLALRQGTVGEPALGIGYYANVIRLGGNLGLAISTDGVGTKILIAEMLRKYDTLGIDCIAMNVNDVICVGAEPLAMVDYLAVQEARADVLEQLGKGLYEGAVQANITIPGGELAQLKDMIAGYHPGEGIDLMGTCVGTVQLDRMILGQEMQPGDVVVGLESSGVHSNGFTLARKALFDAGGYAPEAHAPDLGRSVGEALLEPTRIYVKPVWQMICELPVHGLYHITGDGLLNLNRGERPLGFDLEWLPEPQPIFQLIAKSGGVDAPEMYRTFNMGVGYILVTPKERALKVISHLARFKQHAWIVGEIIKGKGVTIQ